MPHDVVDFSRRGDLSEWMDEPCDPEVMYACLRDMAKANSWTLAYWPLLQWLGSFAKRLDQPIRILDVGCGYGDCLRRVEAWARKRNLAVELTGLERNKDAVESARRASPSGSRIQWIQEDIFTYKPDHPFQLVISSLFTHHLDNDQIVRFLQWMEANAKDGWFINDLYRSPVPYHFFRIVSKLFRLHPYVQHDGPISIRRSFIPADWQALCAEAGIAPSNFQLHTVGVVSRLCVSRSKLD
jgi:SAM-dependent methyltransferase